MGVPFITLAGRTHVERVGVSLLTQIGLEELVTRDEEEYVASGGWIGGASRRAGEFARRNAAPHAKFHANGWPGIHKESGRRLPDNVGACRNGDNKVFRSTVE